MSADEMFKKLGYEKIKKDDTTTYLEKNGQCIDFNYKYKNISLWDKTTDLVELEIQELQAINKKCKELGWI